MAKSKPSAVAYVVVYKDEPQGSKVEEGCATWLEALKSAKSVSKDPSKSLVGVFRRRTYGLSKGEATILGLVVD